jgi:hypothetical protein
LILSTYYQFGTPTGKAFDGEITWVDPSSTATALPPYPAPAVIAQGRFKRLGPHHATTGFEPHAVWAGADTVIFKSNMSGMSEVYSIDVKGIQGSQ